MLAAGDAQAAYAAQRARSRSHDPRAERECGSAWRRVGYRRAPVGSAYSTLDSISPRDKYLNVRAAWERPWRRVRETLHAGMMLCARRAHGPGCGPGCGPRRGPRRPAAP